MRRPSLPFEAIGLHTKIRRASLCATPALKEKTMSPGQDEQNDESNAEPKPVPPVEQKPEPDNFEDDEEEFDEEEDDED